MEKKNNLDPQYNNLLKDILKNGIKKQTRNGEVFSLFGKQIRHDMKDGFPLLTGKKMFFKGVVTELLWFLRGDTNIKFLVDNDCHIWDGDAFRNYWENNKFLSGPKWLKPVTYSNGNVGAEMYNMEEFINKIKTYSDFAEIYGELGPIYGKQWRSWVWDRDMDYGTESSVDQIQNLINELKTNPDSRRLMVSAWNVGELDQMVLPPCHYGFQVYTRELSEGERGLLLQPYGLDPLTKEGRDRLWKKNNLPTRAISLMWNQRSVDTFLGLPFNIASYGLLLEMIAKTVNMVPDELIGNLGDTHLYLNHIEQAKEQIERTSFELPTLNINTEFWQTESGECGEGPLNAIAIFNSFKDDNFCKCLLEEDIQLSNYQAHPTIKAPLSN